MEGGEVRERVFEGEWMGGRDGWRQGRRVSLMHGDINIRDVRTYVPDVST